MHCKNRGVPHILKSYGLNVSGWSGDGGKEATEEIVEVVETVEVANAIDARETVEAVEAMEVANAIDAVKAVKTIEVVNAVEAVEAKSGRDLYGIATATGRDGILLIINGQVDTSAYTVPSCRERDGTVAKLKLARGTSGNGAGYVWRGAREMWQGGAGRSAR